MSIWLAMITEDETEYHVKFEGHDNVDSAKNEIHEINKRLLLDKKIPLPYYVYEADKPAYGYEAYNLDDLDFNFYKELTPEEENRKKEFMGEKVKELEKAFATGDKDVIEKTAKKVLEEAKENSKK